MSLSAIHKEITELLLTKIKEGRFLLNERLPSERELAKELNVSRGSLRESLRVLEQQNWIRNGKNGRYVIRNEDVDVSADRTLSQMMEAEIKDLIEARTALDDTIIQLACKRATDEDILEIEDCMRKQFDALLISQSRLTQDVFFHITIAKAAHNKALLGMYSLNIELMDIIRRTSFKSLQRRHEILKEHQMILDAIKAHDPLMGQLAVRLHTRAIRQQFKALEESGFTL